MALASLLLAMLAAPLVLATHVVITRSNPRLATAWVLAVVGLLALSVALAAVAVILEISRPTR
jgi:hypothetical protein